MEFIKTDKSLILKVDHDVEKMLLVQYKDDGDIDTDDAMYEYFEDILANSEFTWIEPEEIGALTAAPILGIYDENNKVIEAYEFMDYQTKSLLEDLLEYGEAKLQKR